MCVCVCVCVRERERERERERGRESLRLPLELNKENGPKLVSGTKKILVLFPVAVFSSHKHKSVYKLSPQSRL